AHMEAADRDLHAARAELAGDRHGARELIRLDADQADEAIMTRALELARDSLDRDPDIHLVMRIDLDRDVLPEHLPLGPVLRDAIEAGHRIRWNPGLPPLDDIALLVVMGRLDNLDMEDRHRQAPPLL